MTVLNVSALATLGPGGSFSNLRGTQGFYINLELVSQMPWAKPIKSVSPAI